MGNIFTELDKKIGDEDELILSRLKEDPIHEDSWRKISHHLRLPYHTLSDPEKVLLLSLIENNHMFLIADAGEYD